MTIETLDKLSARIDAMSILLQIALHDLTPEYRRLLSDGYMPSVRQFHEVLLQGRVTDEYLDALLAEGDVWNKRLLKSESGAPPQT